MMEKTAVAIEIEPYHDPSEQIAHNRRHWKRYATEPEDVVLTVARGKQHAVIVDESIGGLGVKVAHIKRLKPGQEVTVCFRGLDIAAQVKNIREDEDGLYHVGLGWLDSGLNLGPTDAPPRKERATFIRQKGVWLVCDLVQEAPEDMVTIVLWNNKYFKVNAGRLAEKTVAQRDQELQDMDCDITLLAALYQLGDCGTLAETREAILNFEFAIAWVD